MNGATGGILRRATTELLEIAYEESGPPDGTPVVLLHGFPYDIRSYDEVAALLATEGLAAEGARVIVPYLRGYGGTRFLDAAAPRSGQQAALAQDLLDLMDVLGIDRAIVGGYDWGGRTACIAAALWPERISGLVTVDGYSIQNIAVSAEPEPAVVERAFWYQYYFHSERGRRGLEQNRNELLELLWSDWSPTWQFGHDAFLRTAKSFENADFVEVVLHSYRHRYGLVAGDPRYDELESRLAQQPRITVPTVICEPGSDGLPEPESWDEADFFTGQVERRRVAIAGHNLPQQCPAEFADAVRALLRFT